MVGQNEEDFLQCDHQLQMLVQEGTMFSLRRQYVGQRPNESSHYGASRGNNDVGPGKHPNPTWQPTQRRKSVTKQKQQVVSSPPHPYPRPKQAVTSTSIERDTEEEDQTKVI